MLYHAVLCRPRHSTEAEGPTLAEVFALSNTMSCVVVGKAVDLALLQPSSYEMGEAHPCLAWLGSLTVAKHWYYGIWPHQDVEKW